MNPNSRSGATIQVSGWGCWLVLLAFGILFGFVGLGWLAGSFLVLFFALLIVPVLFVAGLSWWVRRSLVRAPCPVCQTEFSALQGNPCRCPGCGEPLQVRAGRFERLTPEGTIDVEAVTTEVEVGEVIDVLPVLPDTTSATELKPDDASGSYEN